MPLAAAFNLSLELTRLIPLDLVGQTAQHAFFSLARQIKNSGSDITIERDLAQLFGRSRIAPQMDSSFRALVSHCSNVPLTDEISLLSGPGPTFTRALQERAYFSTLVQLSLLTWAYEPMHLARGLVESLEQKYQDAPDAFLPPPDLRDVYAVLVVIREQISHYEWATILKAVALLLETQIHFGDEGTSFRAIKSLLDMFPLVQNLPLDRMIHITGHSHSLHVIVWAHHVLGLNVLVKTKKNEFVRFGNGTEQVYIEFGLSTRPTVTLFDSTSTPMGILFVERNHDYEGIDYYYDYGSMAYLSLVALKGYGKIELEKFFERDVAQLLEVTTDFMHKAVAMALLIFNALRLQNGEQNRSLLNPKARRRILEISELLFDSKFDEEKLDHYIGCYRMQPINEKLDPPSSIPKLSDNVTTIISLPRWGQGLLYARDLAILLIALEHVDGIDKFERLELRNIWKIRSTDLSRRVSTWDGQTIITIYRRTMFEILASTLSSDEEPMKKETCSMLSSHGWTIYLSSFDPDDPASIDTTRIKLANGVPHRNGIRLSAIVDGPLGFSLHTHQISRIHEGEIVEPLCAINVKRSRPLINIDGDYMSISVTFAMEDKDMLRMIRNCMAGYDVLHKALWHTNLTVPCFHSAMFPPLCLPPDCGAYSLAFANSSLDPRIVIFLTLDCTQARWVVLSAIAGREGDHERQAMLRRNDCCPSCAVQQAIERPGKWAVIL